MPGPYSVVCRVAPLKPGNLRGAHVHQTREHTYEMPNADPKRKHLNRFIHGSGDVEGDVNAILSQHPLAHPNGTICAELILSADDEYFDWICPGWRTGASSKAFEGWVNHNLHFLKKTYPGLASAVLHMDEGTPHIHAMVVPLATYEQGYRRGSKEVTKVHYNRIFGDDAQTIALARQTKNSELTKLGRLQTVYAKAMRPLKLVRGIKNSRAHHRSVKEHQALVNRPVNVPVIPELHVIERGVTDTAKSALGIDNETDKRIAKATSELSKYRKELTIYQKQLASKAKEFDTMREQNMEMHKALVLKDEVISKITQELTLSKDEVAKLRQYPLQDVAKALNYDGPLSKEDGKPVWRNAIDMVKEVSGLDYAKSVAFLYHEIGIDETIAAASSHGIDNATDIVKSTASRKAPRPYTKQEIAIRYELDKQLTHLDSQAYRITLMHAENKMTYNHGKGKGENGSEKFYTKDEVIQLIPKLNNENWRRQYNVFITPLDENKHYVLIDDLVDETLADVKANGFTPNLIQRTSGLSIQAVFTLPKSDVTKEVGNAWFKDMNKLYGDKNILGFVHPFRAAGFRNVKPKHLNAKTDKFPVVTLLERVKGLCSKAIDACRTIAEATAALAPGRAVAVPKGLVERHVYDVPSAQPDDHAKHYAARFYGWCTDRYEAGVDWSRADWILIQRMQKAGYSADVIAGTVLECSPGLAERHADKARYISTTLGNAGSGGFRP